MFKIKQFLVVINSVVKIKQFFAVISPVVKIKQFFVVISPVVKIQQFFVVISLGPVVQRPDNFIQWISRYPSVSICAKISVFPLVQANMHTLTTVKFGSVRKSWTTFYGKYILHPE